MANSVISNTPVWHDSGVSGAGPAQWYGNVAPNGDTAPWLGCPVGSKYCAKTSATAATWYTKIAANGTDADWVSTEGVGQNGALIMGAGTTAVPITTATANKNFIDYKVSTTATTAGSDTRAAYLRLYLAGATTGGGDALRVYTTVNAAVGTARGTHSSLSFGTSGSVSGTGNALQGTLQLKAGTATGTVAAVMGEIWLDAATSAPPASSHGIIRASVGGDVTNIAAVTNLLLIDGVKSTAASAATTNMITTGAADSPSDTEIRVLINGTPYWILATATAPAA